MRAAIALVLFFNTVLIFWVVLIASSTQETVAELKLRVSQASHSEADVDQLAARLVPLIDRRLSPLLEAPDAPTTHAQALVERILPLLSQYVTRTVEPPDAAFTDAKTLFESELAAGHFQAAYDLLLAASRIDATQPVLIDLVEAFVAKANGSADETAADLADALKSRADALVPFQTPNRVVEARRRLIALESTTAANQPESNQLDKATDKDPFESYLRVAENDSLPLTLRSAAVEQARQMSDAAMLDAAVANAGESIDIRAQYKELLERLDRAERLCLNGLFSEWCIKRDQWKRQADAILNGNGTAAIAQEPQTGTEPQASTSSLASVSAAGVTLLQEVSPYSKANMPTAVQAEEALASDIETLQRYRAWNRNQAVLKAISDVEARWKKDSYEISLTKLADALQEEELLIPYVAERFNQKWNEAFKGLEDKRPEKAPEMLKRRFLSRLLRNGGLP